ncbi:MAG: YcaO-like family protein [Gemmatimonadaceae bacterium]|nr:YcaO-like family protein [Gemmatimonadaceae bacterium]
MRGLPVGVGSPIHVAMASVAGRVESLHGQTLTNCFGTGTTAHEAAARARDEYLERWSGFAHAGVAVRLATLAELGHRALHPNDVLLVSERQFAAAGITSPYATDAPVGWVEARGLTTDRRTLVPAQLVYYGYGREFAFSFGSADSNGAAAGVTVEDAARRALLELVERDSVALWWYNRLRRPAVALDAIADPLVGEILGWLNERGRNVWALDLTSDLGIPVVVAMSARRGHARPHIRFGFGANPDRALAARRALVELMQDEGIVRAQRAGLLGVQDEERRWRREGTITSAPFLVPLRGRARIPRAMRRDSLEAIARRLAARGHEPLLVEQTRPETGRVVVKCFAPGLRPWWPRFAPGRLFDAPVRAGWSQTRRRESQLHSVPIWF